VSKLTFSRESSPGPARIGIGGPVGSGKTALIESLIPKFLNSGIEVGIVTNDLVTREDANRLKAGGLVEPDHIIGVECGACPHTVIREDPTLNIEAVDILEQKFPSLSLVILESGGDNLASTFSLDLVDWWMFVIDVGAGNDIPRKRGPGVLQCDLLVINKVDIAPHVGVDLEILKEEAEEIRGSSPVAYTNCRSGEGIEDVLNAIRRHALLEDT
tara:strand:- start:2377 stop:3021 length:645 start_codon:yes stop_codon:yes gene_type:complete